jgi:CelD/BcsL family acetyltransferase involved in cellulose biosynthesis
MTQIAESTATKLSIRVFTDIHDPDLVCHWRRIEEEADCFPQMHYGWCEPWWRLRSGRRQLHIVTVRDDSGRIVGIAPLCIEAKPGLRVLRSFPIHFGDYYSFLIDQQGARLRAETALVDHLLTYAHWHVVHLVNVSSLSSLWAVLQERGCVARELTKIHAASFRDLSFDEFLARLSKNTRNQFGKKLRRLSRNGPVTLECVEGAAGYMKYFHELRRIYDARWSDDHQPPPDDDFYRCRNEAVTACFDKGKMMLFLMKRGGCVLAYRLGFMHRDCFYDWKVSHDPQADPYSPGVLTIGLAIEELIARGYERFDFMTGDYRYKRSWSTHDSEGSNYEILAGSRFLPAALYVKYRVRWKDHLRRAYERSMKHVLLRFVSRWLVSLRRRIRQ